MTAQGIINTLCYATENPLYMYPPASLCQLRLVKEKNRGWMSEEVKEKHNTLLLTKLQGDKSECEIISPFFCSLCVFFFSSSGAFWMVPRNCPGLPSSVLHIKCNTELTLMCDFPSTCRPKWICTSTIIFCHYSFWVRHCAEIQTILAGWHKKMWRKMKRKRVKLVWLWQ